ncbi:unnamed protein product [Linum tenue]|uniref:BED-type domain-containing protein n=1 Tax=Linum tenue TaxID=586396 RepID=A0AAV0H8L9_9ROSI|nr:unnamed protein product [Linum tenue]
MEDLSHHIDLSTGAMDARARRSKVWENLTQVESEEEVKLQCNHYMKVFGCNPNKNGTVSLWRHLKMCTKGNFQD